MNLQVRGFTQAEEASRAVLAQRAEDYDAKLGLSLAIRGQLDPVSPGSRLAEAEQQLAAAERLSPERPEAYFNEAILVQEFTARAGGTQEQKAGLSRAEGLFATFLARAGERVDLREAREHAARRVADIDTILGFLGEADRAAN